MNNLKNKVSLIGNLGMNPEVKEFENGNKRAKISLATSEVYMKDGERVTETQWHNLVAWGKKAELMERLLKKGSQVAVDGKLVNRSYEVEGEKKYITEVVVNEFMSFDQATANK